MKKYIFAVAFAGFCWGFMGVFVRKLAEFGISSSDVIAIRCLLAAVMFGILILIKDKRRFVIKLKDSWVFICSGLVSLLFFSYCNFNAIRLLDLSVAATLLYIAPAVVTLLSAVFFAEKLTAKKLFAVFISLAGCAFVSGITSSFSFSAEGLLFGLGAGTGYALYTIFSRFALERGYDGTTVNFYSCLLAGIGSIIIWGVKDTVHAAVTAPISILWCIATALFTGFLPYLFYVYGLTGLENGKASVIASIEPVTAAVLGVAVYGEKLTAPIIVGIVMVLTAIVLLNTSFGKKKTKTV